MRCVASLSLSLSLSLEKPDFENGKCIGVLRLFLSLSLLFLTEDHDCPLDIKHWKSFEDVLH